MDAKIEKLRPEEATLMLAFMIARSDGKVRPEERQVMARRLGQKLRGMDEEDLTALTLRAQNDLVKFGADAAMQMVKHAFKTHGERLHAMEVALEVAKADGRVDHAETSNLVTMADVLDLTQEELANLVKRIL